MTDIAKCSGNMIDSTFKCPKRKECYRYTALDGMWQLYMATLYNKETDKCEYFWEETCLKQ